MRAEMAAARLRWSATLRLAFRNILRHKGRAATTLAAVTFGVVALILSQGFVEDIFVQLAEAIIHSQTGHVQIAKEGYFAEGAQRPEKFLLEDVEGARARIAQLPEVDDVLARINFAGLLSNGRADLAILGEGIDPEREAKLGSMVRTTAGRRLGGNDHFHVEVGHGVAQALKLEPGARAILLATTGDGGMNTLDVEVVGVFQSFSKDYDNRAIRIPLSAAQELLNAGGANTLVVSLKRTEDTDRVGAILGERARALGMEVRTWPQLNDFHPKTVALYDRQFGALLLIILLMVVLSVSNSVNMTVFERTAEFGTARALGNRGSHVLRLIMLENTILGLVGSIAGVVLGIALAHAISAVGIPMPPPPNADLAYTAYIRPTFHSVAVSFVVGLLATSLAALLPAIRMARMPIALALRQGV